MHRVEQLSDRPAGTVPENAIPFKNLIPLDEIIAEVKKIGKGSLTVEREYRSIVGRFGNEFEILLNANESELRNAIAQPLVEAILCVRQGKVDIRPGYDGEYGVIGIANKEALNKNKQEQLDLF